MKIVIGEKYKVLIGAKIGEVVLTVTELNNGFYKGIDAHGNIYGFDKFDVLEKG